MSGEITWVQFLVFFNYLLNFLWILRSFSCKLEMYGIIGYEIDGW